MQAGVSKGFGLAGKAYLGSRVGSLDVRNGPHKLSVVKQ